MYPIWYQSVMHRTMYPIVSTGMALLFSVRTWGWRQVPRTGGVLVVVNHQSFFDPIVVGIALRRRCMYLARKTLFDNPLFAWLIKTFGAIPIDQEKPRVGDIQTALELLRRGEAVVLFPEGERTPHGQIMPLRPGVALLVRRGQVPVLPVGIAGAYELWPRYHFWPRLCPVWSRRPYREPQPPHSSPASTVSSSKGRIAIRRGIAVVVGTPIPFAELRGLSNEAVLQRLSTVLHDLVQQAERRRFACAE